jgi:hypothetical protein
MLPATVAPQIQCLSSIREVGRFSCVCVGPELAAAPVMRRLGAICLVLLSFTACAGPRYHAHGGHRSGFHHHHHRGPDFLMVLQGVAAIADIAADLAEISAHTQPATQVNVQPAPSYDPPAAPWSSEQPVRPLPGLVGR